MQHDSRSLHGWRQLTTGVPAALAQAGGTAQLSRRLADLVGCEAATLAPSTLHLFWDLFEILAGDTGSIYFDLGAYPIAHWGIERAAACGVPVHGFPHHGARDLWKQLAQNSAFARHPIIVTDGFCPGCGQMAPLNDYLKIIQKIDGRLVIDDTQAMGILGDSPERVQPYGHGGGGSLRWCHIQHPAIVVVSSLAKGFGVPVAFLAGEKMAVKRFQAQSKTRMHCSPPSIAVIRALEHALDENETEGAALRNRLLQLIQYFRGKVAELGLNPSGRFFPVQTFSEIPGISPIILYHRLLKQGIRTVLHQGRQTSTARISFILNAGHEFEDIDRVVSSLGELLYSPGKSYRLLDEEKVSGVSRCQSNSRFDRC